MKDPGMMMWRTWMDTNSTSLRTSVVYGSWERTVGLITSTRRPTSQNYICLDCAHQSQGHRHLHRRGYRPTPTFEDGVWAGPPTSAPFGSCGARTLIRSTTHNAKKICSVCVFLIQKIEILHILSCSWPDCFFC